MFQEERADAQTKVYNQIKILGDIIKLDDEIDKDYIYQQAEKLRKLRKEFSALHAKCQILLEGEEERTEEEKIAEKVDQDVETIHASWLSEHQLSPPVVKKASSQRTRTSRFSKSSRSRSSKSSGRLSEKLAEEQTKLAALQIETRHRSAVQKKKMELEEIE